MIKFDKLKLKTTPNNIFNINISSFITKMKNNVIIEYKYNIKTPYDLLILVDLNHNELIIEFTGKILLDNYPYLISSDTIRECLERINGLGICTLNIDDIILHAEVLKCDITKDVECRCIDEVISTIQYNITNYNKWNVSRYNNGIVINNKVSTAKRKKRITIYDKGKEMMRSNNIDFVNCLSYKNSVLDYFNGKIRFETNLNSMELIRKLLNIPNNNIQTVLNAKTNPILSVFDEAVKKDCCSRQISNLSDYKNYLLIKDCDFDMAKVEATVRSYSGKTTSITRTMTPFRELYAKLKTATDSNINIRDLVA